MGFGPITAYKKVNYSSDFHVWTFAYDVSGLSSVKLKFRTDNDGQNPIESTQNETYSGGAEVNSWTEIEMTRRPMADDPIDPELNFFILPKAKADLCYAEIKGLKDALVDYYVEATDTKGNIFRSPIQHVYVGNGDGDTNSGTNGNVSWSPLTPTTTNNIVITCKNATSTSKLHWGVRWMDLLPMLLINRLAQLFRLEALWKTPFTSVDGNWQVTLGPFNNPAQAVSKINFVIKHESSWDNNNGSDYLINISGTINNNPIGQNISKTIDQNGRYTFALADIGFNSPQK